MRSFWDSSWESIDPGRVAEYIGTFDMCADNMVTILHQYDVRSVCDAGCGCGIYALKLAGNGFSVSGFDVSAYAVQIAQALFEKTEFSADLKESDVLATGYADGQFDGVISRDVLDHIRKADAVIALRELFRITRPGGVILFTLDSLDEEYKSETHIVNADGDYLFTDGKWNGMVFHPYDREEVCEIIPSGVRCEIGDRHGELTVLLIKEMEDAER